MRNRLFLFFFNFLNLNLNFYLFLFIYFLFQIVKMNLSLKNLREIQLEGAGVLGWSCSWISKRNRNATVRHDSRGSKQETIDERHHYSGHLLLLFLFSVCILVKQCDN